MSFAKKFTRLITVNKESYRWYLRDNILEFEARHIAVQHVGVPGQLLLLDPFSMAISPKAIRAAILYGLEQGWTPHSAGTPMYIAYTENSFKVLSAQRPYLFIDQRPITLTAL